MTLRHNFGGHKKIPNHNIYFKYDRGFKKQAGKWAAVSKNGREKWPAVSKNGWGHVYAALAAGPLIGFVVLLSCYGAVVGGVCWVGCSVCWVVCAGWGVVCVYAALASTSRFGFGFGVRVGYRFAFRVQVRD
jgi:hypothetical protein